MQTSNVTAVIVVTDGKISRHTNRTNSSSQACFTHTQVTLAV